MACNFFGLACKVYMVKVSFEQKPYRQAMMQMFGAEVTPSPSRETAAGRAILEKDPDCTGSLGIAISEAVELAVQDPQCRYALGSVLNHVLMHQTVIGLETMKQLEMAGDYPDIIVGCVGGGSNFAGMYLPFVKEKIEGKKPDLRIINVEPESCPTLTKGLYAYDFGDVAGMAPIAKMFTLGHGFMPPPVHAGGLRYHGMAPIICHLHKLGFVEARAVPQLATFEAGVQFARAEGIISAPETNHAIRVAIDEALQCKKEGKSKVILLAHSGHGHFDLAAYEAYLSGKLSDYAYPEDMVKAALSELPEVPAEYK
jgi:tryptophan synthase beta chain